MGEQIYLCLGSGSFHAAAPRKKNKTTLKYTLPASLAHPMSLCQPAVQPALFLWTLPALTLARQHRPKPASQGVPLMCKSPLRTSCAEHSTLSMRSL